MSAAFMLPVVGLSASSPVYIVVCFPTPGFMVWLALFALYCTKCHKFQEQEQQKQKYKVTDKELAHKHTAVC